MMVNVGCGPHTADDWVNIDASHKAWLAKHPRLADMLYKLGIITVHDRNAAQEWSADIVRRDVTESLPFEDGSVQYIYSSHMLEHLSREEALEFCRECHRVLEGDGWVRIVVPNLRVYAERYVEGDEAFYADEDGPLADRFMKKNMFHDYHEWAYDAESLSYLFAESGFDEADIHERTFRVGEVPDLEVIETHEPPKSVYIEAQK